MSLEHIIQKASDFWDKNKTIIRTISFNALIATTITDIYITELHPVLKKKILHEPSEEQYRQKYIPDYTYSTKGTIGYIVAENIHTQEEHIIADRRPIINRMPWYLGAGLLLIGMHRKGIKGFARQTVKEWNHATPEQKRMIKYSTILSTTAAIAYSYYHMQTNDGIFDRMFEAMLVISTPALTYNFSSQKAAKDRYKKALESNDLESIDYCNGKALQLRERVKKDLRKGNTEYAIQDTIELSKLYRKITEQEEEPDNPGISSIENIGNLFQRIRTRISSTRKNNILLLLENVNSDTGYAYSDVEYMIKTDTTHSLEYAIYGYELSTTKENRKTNAERIIQIASSKKAIIHWDTHSKNPVYYITLPEIKKAYIVKSGEKAEIQTEAQQTDYFRQKIHVSGLVIPEISVIQQRNSDFTNNNFYLLSEFMGETNARDYFLSLHHNIQNNDMLKLEKICRMQVYFAEHGINTTKIERMKKAVHDYQQLSEMIQGPNSNCIEILLKNDCHFPFVYDRDGHLNNYILGSRGEVACIDLEARPLSDPTYMLVKLLDDAPILGTKKEDIELRNKLLQIHNDLLGIASDKPYSEPHYYSSIVIKAMGYLAFSSQLPADPIIEEKRAYHLQRAAWAIEVLTNRYESQYSRAELFELNQFKEKLYSNSK